MDRESRQREATENLRRSFGLTGQGLPLTMQAASMQRRMFPRQPMEGEESHEEKRNACLRKIELKSRDEGNSTRRVMNTVAATDPDAVNAFNVIFDCRKEVGSTSDRPRSDRPKTFNVTRAKKLIRMRIKRNSKRSIRKMAQNLNISHTATRSIVRKDLKLKPYKF
ncbi:hypothetical protein WR25_04951 [Diploscapter pachys]|uniref:Transposase Tc1-like domain-containing protein n=1 Tax=Diploscapter pachys TaxID=2018661 RepID=A0A2A2JQQ8_9BILA|nr:hypothetical protein WR25_04951 [Diploscapter pachys]